jgi:hypothetical protein
LPLESCDVPGELVEVVQGGGELIGPGLGRRYEVGVVSGNRGDPDLIQITLIEGVPDEVGPSEEVVEVVDRPTVEAALIVRVLTDEVPIAIQPQAAAVVIVDGCGVNPFVQRQRLSS